jgi:hypothetical protein
MEYPLNNLSFFRMEGRFSFFTFDELKQEAITSQLDVRARPAKELDQFLATPSVGAPTPNHPSTVRHVSRSDDEAAEKTFLRPVRDRSSAGVSERIINKVLGTQRPDCVTVPQEPFNLAQSLPGGSPLVDLLRVRARNELGWNQLMDGISLASANRTPSHHEFRNVNEITLGETLGSRILDIIATLRDYRSQLKEKLHITLLAGDSESTSIPPEVLRKFSDNRRPIHFRRPAAWVKGTPKALIPVRFMIGNVGYAVHLRLDLGSHSGEGTNNLCLRTGTLQPEIQTLLDVAGPLVGVGIKDDIDKFNDMLELVFGKRLIFSKPLDAAVISLRTGPPSETTPGISLLRSCLKPCSCTSVVTPPS